MKSKIAGMMAICLCICLSFAVGTEFSNAAAKTATPPSIKIKSVKSETANSVLVKWKKKKCSGYLLQYGLNRNALDVSGNSIYIKKTKSSRSIEKLQSGKQYFFRIRTYKTKKGKKSFGKWSAPVSLVVHKHTFKKNDNEMICGCGKAYTGSAKAAEKIELKAPKKAKILKIKSSDAGKATIKWQHIKCSNYILRYGTGKNVGSSGTKTIINGSKSSITLKGLTPGKQYYFVIRAFNAKDKVKRYGETSVLSQCKIHKHNYFKVGKTSDKKSYMYYCDCGRSYKKAVPTEEPTPIKPKTAVSLTVPKKTVSNTSVTVVGRNNSGFTYKYRLYKQNNNKLFKSYKGYLTYHGCSTCALTTILNATVPELESYTPDKVITKVIKPTIGKAAFNKNFIKKDASGKNKKASGKDGRKPLGLRGISAVLDKYGIEHKYVFTNSKANAAKEIRSHLKTGNPVIFTTAKCLYTNSGAHTMIMLGLDKKGKVIVGDSCLRNKAVWGKHRGQVKYSGVKKKYKNCNTVKKIVSYFKFRPSTDRISPNYFYSGRGDVGYILVYK